MTGENRPADSYRWTGWVWEITGWSSKTSGTLITHHFRGVYRMFQIDKEKTDRSQDVTDGFCPQNLPRHWYLNETNLLTSIWTWLPRTPLLRAFNPLNAFSDIYLINCPSKSSFALLPRKFEVEEVWMFRFCYFLETSFGFCMIQCACREVLLASKVVSYFYPSYDELSSQNGEVIGLVVYRLGRLPPVCEWHWGVLVAVGLWL